MHPPTATGPSAITASITNTSPPPAAASDLSPLGYYIVDNTYSAPGSGQTVWPAHNGLSECNVVYVDGHVAGAKSTRTGEHAAEQLLNTRGTPLYGPGVDGSYRNDESKWVRHDGVF